MPAHNLFEGLHTTRIYNLLVHGATFEKIPVHPNVLPVIEGVLDPGLLISSLSSIAIGPDEQAQPIHADDQLIPLTRPHVPIICNSMWAITDFTEENGATRLIPRSHLSAEVPNPLDQLRIHCGRNAQGQRPGVGRQLVARRRRQQDQSSPSGHRHELLRRLHPPAGEPAAGRYRLNWSRRFPDASRSWWATPSTTALVGHIDKQHPAKYVLTENEGVDMVWDLLKV